MSAREIVDVAMADGCLELANGGKTPVRTMQSKLSTHIKRADEHSIFVRTEPGRFYLRELMPDASDEYKAPPFRAANPRERIYVFPQELLDEIGRFQGISVDWLPYFDQLVKGAKCSALDRMMAEGTAAVKQLLTYIMVRDPSGSLLCFDRGVVNRVALNLRGLSCVGFGGHVRAAAATLFDVDEIGLYRSAAAELCEELVLPDEERTELETRPDKWLRLVGVLNDDSSPNGERHFAFLFEYMTSFHDLWSKPRGREKSVNRVRWLTTATVMKESLHHFELWSQMCIGRFSPELVNASPTVKVRRPSALRRAGVVCFVGQMGSGKTEAVNYMVEECGLSAINSGRVVAELLGLPSVPATPRAIFQLHAQAFISRPDGPRRLAQAIAGRAASLDGRVIIDGIRHVETVDALRKAVGRRGLSLVYVHAPVHLAYELYRQREDPSVSLTTFLERRSAEVEQRIGDLIDVADAGIYNWMGVDEYRQTLLAFAREYFEVS
jgi:predicted NUDIX family phosphoesterase/dephospho-CoA kinase